MNNNPNILIYQNENGNIKVDVMFEDGSIWLSQAQICEEGELDEEVVVRNYRTTTKILNYSVIPNSWKRI